jgi:nitroreductase
MSVDANTRKFISEMNHARQIRQYRPDPVPEDLINELLQIARWSGSSRNTQPWHFVVVTEKDKLRQLSDLRTPINWVADAPLGIAIVLDGEGGEASEAYDEGRVTERVMIGARVLGLGSGVAWFLEDDREAEAKRILGVPQDRVLRSIIAIGYPITSKDPRPNPARGGRKPLSEIVSYNSMS